MLKLIIPSKIVIAKTLTKLKNYLIIRAKDTCKNKLNLLMRDKKMEVLLPKLKKLKMIWIMK